MSFPSNWSAEILTAAPMIAPARQYIYPQQVPGEEDVLARGALLLMVKPAIGGVFMATCALGFSDPSMPTGVFACPNPDELCAVAGGYAYIVDVTRPEGCRQVSFRPVTRVVPLPSHGLLLFVGFHAVLAWGSGGEVWQTKRLSSEGVQLGSVEGDVLHGVGWDLMTDKDVAFTVDLKTGEATGGAAPR